MEKLNSLGEILFQEFDLKNRDRKGANNLVVDYLACLHNTPT